MCNLNGKTAVVIGRGSGRAIAQLFARQGAAVYIVGFNAVAGQQAQIVTAFQAIGRVDILVNNAGIAHVGNVKTTTEADFAAS